MATKEEMLVDILKSSEERMTQWEIDFINNIKMLGSLRHLTGRQIIKLSDIYNKVKGRG